MKRSYLFLLLLLIAGQTARAQQDFYRTDRIQKIYVWFGFSNWDYRLDTAKAGTDDYIMADSVRINDSVYAQVGVKYKGNSSYDSTYRKNPIHIELDTWLNQDYGGINDIKLGNGYSDPSLIREPLAYALLGNYMHCPRAGFAQVYVNGQYLGIYSNVEDVSKKFCATHFSASKKNTFFKCNPLLNPSPATKSNLRYISADSAAYANLYELKSNLGWTDLVNLCDTVTNHSSSLSAILNVDRAIWMLAFDNALVNLDSYMGAFAQNYYLFKDNSGHFNPIVWDLNMAFGGFVYLGSSNSSMAALTTTNMQQLPTTVHATDPYWPLINAVMSNAQYKRMYHAHLRTLLQENFSNSTYKTSAAALISTIDTAVASDSGNFFSYAQFKNGMTSDVVVGSYTVPGIANLMDARVSYLNGLADISATPPQLSLEGTIISTTDSMVTVRARVTDTQTASAWAGHRAADGEVFVRVQLFDDGQHNDDAAGDGLFANTIQMVPGQSQLYLYAENTLAGVFLPARAEHNYFTIGRATGIPEPAHAESKTQLYPNPLPEGQVLNVYTSQPLARMNLYGITGQLHHTVAPQQPHAGLQQLPVPVKAGSYLAELIDEQGNRSHHRLVVTH